MARAHDRKRGNHTILDIKSLAATFQQGQCLTVETYFDEGRFRVLVTVDLTTERYPFVELMHPTRGSSGSCNSCGRCP